MAKVNITREKEKFNPVTFSVTLETQEEMDFFASVFNSRSVCNAASEESMFSIIDNIVEELEEYGADVNRFCDPIDSFKKPTKKTI